MSKLIFIHICESIFEFMMWHAHYSTRCRIYIDYEERERMRIVCAWSPLLIEYMSCSPIFSLSFLSLSLSFVSFLLSLCLSLAYVQLLDVRSSCQTGMKYEEEREMLISTRRIIINFEILFNLYKNQLIIYLIVFFLLLYILFYIQNENLQFIFIKFSFMRIHKRFT